MGIRDFGTIEGTFVEWDCSCLAVAAVDYSGLGTWRSSGIGDLQMPRECQVGKENQVAIGKATRA